MALIMREVIRLKKRTAILQCTSIFLGFDDRKGYKLIRFKCDVPTASWNPQFECSKTGIVGCVQCLHGITLSDLQEDYAQRTAREILRVVEQFCTPLGDVIDESLYRKLCTATKGIVADGALQKTAHFLKLQAMPNVVLVLRDPAHVIRIACKEPLHRTGRFEEQYKRLFGDRHALLKDRK